jgi:hypothetical protein
MSAHLITFFKSILVLFTFSLIISGCSGKSGNEEAIIKALEESLEGSNKSINISSTTILKSLEEKTQDPATKDRADIWFPKASQIAKLSSEVFNYVEGLKKLEEVSSEKIKELFVSLNKYRENVRNIDSSMRYDFGESLILVSNSFDSTGQTYKEFENKYFRNSTQAFTLAMLTKLQNNIKIIENKTLSYCHMKIGSLDGDNFDSFSTIVGQSSSYVKAGEQVKIMAGVGAFSKTAKPQITINGRVVELGEEGFATYKFKASSKNGRHLVPVKISFLNLATGKDETHEVNVEYTVAKQCDQ